MAKSGAILTFGNEAYVTAKNLVKLVASPALPKSETVKQEEGAEALEECRGPRDRESRRDHQQRQPATGRREHGRGDGAARQPIPASLKRGKNVLVLLTDNLGRACDWPGLGDLKGLYGHVYDAQPVRTRKPVLKASDGFAKRMIPRQHAWMLPQLERMPVHSADLDVSLRTVTPVHLSFTDLPHPVAILCNGRAVQFFPRPMDGVKLSGYGGGPHPKTTSLLFAQLRLEFF